MTGTYDVKIGEQIMGRIRVEKQGLYYHFSCRCSLSGKTAHRVVLNCGGVRQDLGICVPMDGQFGLEKRIPCKRFFPGRPEFFLLPQKKNGEGKYVPVFPEEPFAYMAKLKNAYLEIREGQAGIVIPE